MCGLSASNKKGAIFQGFLDLERVKMVEMTMDEARAYAAQCWCEPSTSAIEMDVTLSEIFAKRLMGVAKRARVEEKRRCADIAERFAMFSGESIADEIRG